MHCSLDSTMPYARMPHAIRTAREQAMQAWLEEGGLALAGSAEPDADQEMDTVAGDDTASSAEGAACSDNERSDMTGVFVGRAIEDAGARLLSLADGADFGGGIGARLAPDKYALATLSPQWAAQNFEISKLLLRKARMRITAAPNFFRVLSRTNCRYYSELSAEAVADLHRHGLASYVLAPGELRRGFQRLKAAEEYAENSD